MKRSGSTGETMAERRAPAAADVGAATPDFVLVEPQHFLNTLERVERRKALSPEYKVLKAQRRRTQAQEERRRHNEERHAKARRMELATLETERLEEAAARIEAKLVEAQLRRECLLNERSAAFAQCEERRQLLLHQTRVTRHNELLRFATAAVPLLGAYAEVGLAVPCRLNSAQIEQILCRDPREHCEHCGSNPPVRCPVLKASHPRSLVGAAAKFFALTAEVLRWLTTARSEPVTDAARAKVSAVKAPEQPPIPSAPQFLPLSFHCAASVGEGHEAAQFCASNVIVLLEEVRVAARWAADGAEEQHEQDSAAAATDFSATEHLRHSLSRFLKAWRRYVPEMQRDLAEHAVADKSRLVQQMSSAYIQLAKAQGHRAADIRRRCEALEVSACTPSRRAKEELLAEKRRDLTEAIDLQMSDLRRRIAAVGGSAAVESLEARLAELMEQDSSSARSPGSSPADSCTDAPSPLGLSPARQHTDPGSLSTGDDTATPQDTDDDSTCRKSPRGNRWRNSSQALRSALRADRRRAARPPFRLPSVGETEDKGHDGDADE